MRQYRSSVSLQSRCMIKSSQSLRERDQCAACAFSGGVMFSTRFPASKTRRYHSYPTHSLCYDETTTRGQARSRPREESERTKWSSLAVHPCAEVHELKIALVEFRGACRVGFHAPAHR